MQSPFMLSRLQSVLAVLLIQDALTLAAHAEGGRTLTSIAAVQALTLEEAAQHHPVQVRGIITFYNPVYSLGFIQDETGGIYFKPPPVGGVADAPDLAAGDRVEMTGVTRRGQFSPSISLHPDDATRAGASIGTPAVMRVVKLGSGPLPAAPLVSVDRINTGDFHDQFVRVRTTIRQVVEHLDPAVEQLNVDASSRYGPLNVILICPKNQQPGVKQWENVEAEISGVVSGEANDRSQLRKVSLLVASVAQIKPSTAAMQAAFDQPAQNFRELLQYRPPQPGGTETRQHVSGIVTLVHPSRGGFYLGSDQGGLWVRTPQQPPVQPGDELDVIGFIAGGAEGVWLEDGIHRIARRAVPFAPRVSTAKQIAQGSDFGSLIRVEGQLIDQFDRPNHRLLYLGAEGRTFYARLAESADTAPPLALENGSWLRLTGVCEKPNDPAARESFSLLLRENADIALISRPPWLSAQRLRWLLGSLLVLTAAVSAWVLLLRRQVTRQTQVIAHQLEQKTLSGERRRIARELHDTLEQQLVGVSIHLDTVAECAPELPVPVSRALDNARAMLAHSRTEAHRSILELRSRAIEHVGLVGAVRESVDALQIITPRITIEVEGEEQRRSQHTEFQLLRIVQESITNALKHAESDNIAVCFRFAPDELRVTITDDGTGFDATQPPAAHGTRFGLLGMRERASKIRATLHFQSTPGTGSIVTVTVPSQPGNQPPRTP